MLMVMRNWGNCISLLSDPMDQTSIVFLKHMSVAVRVENEHHYLHPDPEF